MKWEIKNNRSEWKFVEWSKWAVFKLFDHYEETLRKVGFNSIVDTKTNWIQIIYAFNKFAFFIIVTIFKENVPKINSFQINTSKTKIQTDSQNL